MSPVQICRHWDVDWLDTHTCSCNQCGKFGHWYEDGFVLWRRDGRLKERVQLETATAQ